MSIESAINFIDRMNYDENFRNVVIDCRDSRERNELVNSKGFFFNNEELKTVKKGYIGDSISYEKYGCCNSPDWYG